MLDDALEEKPGGEKARIGMVVIRGNAVVMLEVCVSRPSIADPLPAMLTSNYRLSTESIPTKIEEADNRRLKGLA